jgi:O-antigen ligase
MRGQQKPSRLIVVISIASLITIVGIVASLLLQGRLAGIITGDATTSLHLQSITDAFQQLAVPHTLIGVGYNAYQFAAANADLNSDFTIHSRAGSDNSWLNLWVTTGLIGIILFCLPYVYISSQVISTARRYKNILIIAPLISLLLLIIHSQAVNSLLYGHIQIVIAFLLANSLYGPVPNHS